MAKPSPGSAVHCTEMIEVVNSLESSARTLATYYAVAARRGLDS
jgi:hypothetical protein